MIFAFEKITQDNRKREREKDRDRDRERECATDYRCIEMVKCDQVCIVFGR
jgi:hypothetical protein